MSLLKIYNKDITSLVRSIVLNSKEYCNAMNKDIINRYGLDAVAADERTWKYYLNLNGDKHFSNDDIEVDVIELGEKRIMSKELLDSYPATKIELLKFSDTYISLVKRYPVNETYIKGMLLPVEYDALKKARNGEIVNYSNRYIGSNEQNLMSLLSRYSVNLYVKWFNKLYVNLEVYYFPLVLSLFYTSFIPKIHSYRLDNIHTAKVHDFHMDNFFASNLKIDTKYFNYKSKLWLYQNLRAVMTNNGKDDTLTEIINNVITENQVGIGELKIYRSENKIDERVRDDATKVGFDNQPSILYSEALNDYYKSSKKDVDEIVSAEIDNGYIHNTAYLTIESLVDEINTKLDKNTSIVSKTKILHLIGKEERDILPVPRLNVIVDNILHLASRSSTEFYINYTDSNTNNSYTMLFKDGARLLCYFISKYLEIDTYYFKIESNSILSNRYVDLSNSYLEDKTSMQYINVLESIRVPMNISYGDADNIADYIDEVIYYFISEWILKSQLDSQVSYTNIDIYSKAKNYDSINVAIGTIADEIGLVEPVEYGYNYLIAIKELISVLTNNRLKIDINEVNRESIKLYGDFLKKTTSYNLQILTDGTNDDILHIFDIGIGGLIAEPIVTVKGYFNGLEYLGGELVEDWLLDGVVEDVNDNYALLSPDIHVGYGSYITPRSGIVMKSPKLYTEDSGIYSRIIDNNDAMLSSDLNTGEGVFTRRSANIIKSNRLISAVGSTGRGFILDDSIGHIPIGIGSGDGTSISNNMAIVMDAEEIIVNGTLNSYVVGTNVNNIDTKEN